MDLSIAIVNWNTRDLLKDCLRSVKDNLDQEDLDYEIIVVDNASHDSSVDMVKDEYPGVRLIANKENLGFVLANNQAMEIATGRYILLLNSDTRMMGGGAAEIVSYLDDNPRVGVVTGKMLYEDGEFQPPYRRFPGLLGTILRNTLRRVIGFNTPLLKRFRYEELNPEQEHEVDWVTGAYLYFRRDLLVSGKVFDEEIFMYYEDTLLCWRVRNAGFKVMYLPVAPIIHYRGNSAKKVRPKAILYSFQSSVTYFDRLYGATVASIYRSTVRIIWRLTGFIFHLIPSKKFVEKAELFFFLLDEDKAA